jgi:osmotically-inducible protein OsmY
MKVRTGLLSLGVMLPVLLLGGCEMPAEATATAQKTAAAGMAARDVAVTERVKAALAGDAGIKDHEVAVVTTKGDVRLTGMLDSRGQIDHAIALVRGVEGVRSIHDELGVKKSGG